MDEWTMRLPLCIMTILTVVVADIREQELYDVRLVNGNSSMEGRVEMYLGDSLWGTVCDENWDLTDATVACWQLGYSKAISAHGSEYFGQGSGRIAMSNVSCTGSENTLHSCSQDSFISCGHAEDVGVICGVEDLADEGSVRLVDGKRKYKGRVEIHLSGRWGTVCDREGYWDKDAADVVCQQLGYSHAESSEEAYDEEGTGAILIDSVVCSGEESRLADCSYRNTSGSPNCTHTDDVGVRCHTPSHDTDDISWLDYFAYGLTILFIAAMCCTVYPQFRKRCLRKHSEDLTRSSDRVESNVTLTRYLEVDLDAEAPAYVPPTSADASPPSYYDVIGHPLDYPEVNPSEPNSITYV